jgi:hypothetical protein
MGFNSAFKGLRGTVCTVLSHQNHCCQVNAQADECTEVFSIACTISVVTIQVCKCYTPNPSKIETSS